MPAELASRMEDSEAGKRLTRFDVKSAPLAAFCCKICSLIIEEIITAMVVQPILISPKNITESDWGLDPDNPGAYMDPQTAL